MKMAEEIIRKLEFMGIQVILDDRENISIGSKIKDARILGTPYVLVLGDKQQGENLEIENLKTGEKIQTTIKVKSSMTDWTAKKPTTKPIMAPIIIGKRNKKHPLNLLNILLTAYRILS